MNKKENKRYFATKENFQNALIQLLHSGKSIMNITVKELCDKALYNRATFYLHYKNTLDILIEIEDKELIKIKEHITKIDATGSTSLISFLEYIKDKTTIFKVLFSNKESRFSKNVINTVFENFQEYKKYIKNEFINSCTNECIINNSLSIILHWINSNFSEDTTTISKLIYYSNKSLIDSMTSVSNK